MLLFFYVTGLSKGPFFTSNFFDKDFPKKKCLFYFRCYLMQLCNSYVRFFGFKLHPIIFVVLFAELLALLLLIVLYLLSERRGIRHFIVNMSDGTKNAATITRIVAMFIGSLTINSRTARNMFVD